MKNLLIIEPHMNGHHGVYLRWIVRGAVERNLRVFIATFENSLDHPIFKTMLGECEEAPEIITLPLPETDYMQKSGLWGLLRREIFYRSLFGRFYNEAIQKTTPDFVFLPYLDYCSYAMALFGSPFGHTPWAGIVMRPAFHYEEMGLIGPNSCLHPIKKRLFFRLLANQTLCALFTIDEALHEYVQKTDPTLALRSIYLPEPVELTSTISKQAARQVLGIPEDAVVILIYGGINLRKGVDTLLYTTRAPNFPKNVHILLAGEQSTDVSILLESPLVDSIVNSGRLHQVNDFLYDDREYMVFIASDIMWMVYRNHYGPSMVLAQAGRMGLPVVACNEGVIGWQTNKHELGITVALSNIAQVVTAINHLVQDIENFNRYSNNCKRTFQKYNPGYFAAVIFDGITQKAGK
jgi:glycosyltransferase involved in cell wall biosynthesis